MIASSKTSEAVIAFKNSINPIVIIGALFFIFGFVTWLNSVLIPYLKIACELNNLQSYLVVSCFYGSCLAMALPSAWILKITGFKKGMSTGLIIMAAGALIFIPAAMTRIYALFLLGLFVQGCGLALLQAASNPYITILGPKESAAQRISIMGICNKIAGAAAPIVLGAIALKDTDNITQRLAAMSPLQKDTELSELSGRVIFPYIVIVAILSLIAILVYFSNLPDVKAEGEEETVASSGNGKSSILQFPHLLLGVLTLFLYVGIEVIAGDTIISYGASKGIPLNEAKFFTTFTLLAMIAGYIIGIVAIPKYISQDRALKICAILGLAFSISAVLTDGFMSVLFIAALGLANSLVWPAIWPLAISNLGRFTKIGSSLLIMGIAGGAILPLIYGWIADHIGPQEGYWLGVPCYLFILYYGSLGYKLGNKAS